MICLALTVLFSTAQTSSAQTFTPPSSFVVDGGSAKVLSFPVTAKLTDFILKPGGMTIRTTGTESWPVLAIEPGGEPVQSGTLWIALQINGVWYAAGAERLRPNQLNGTKPEAEGPGEFDTLIGNGWLYDAGRWPHMAGQNPKYRQPYCILVAAGSTRSDDATPLQARTGWRCMEWGTNTVLWTEEEGSTGVTPPSSTPQPPVVQPPAPVDLTPLISRISVVENENLELKRRLEQLEQSEALTEATTNQLAAQLADFIHRPVVTACSAAINLGGAKIPLSCALIWN